jgi:signal transduction histidine kinase
MLAAMFLAAIWLDVTQPAKYPADTYMILGGYVAFAAAIVAATWHNWWWEAKLAGPAHALDIGMFTVLVFLIEGYTSPFFPFFIFLLLSAAIRWGWQETALTAILVTLLYLLIGFLALQSDPQFELYRFLIRTSQLVIVSLILIWFGVTQWVARPPFRASGFMGETFPDQSPLETILAAALHGTGGRTGAILWRDRDARVAPVALISSRNGIAAVSALNWNRTSTAPFLYDFPKERGLSRDADYNLRVLMPQHMIGRESAAALNLDEGLAIPFHAETGEGLLFVERISNLSTDHIELGKEIAAAAEALIQRHALIKAAEESAESRSRIELARDLHDSVVQFLAGAAFRLEAMRRAEGAGRKLEPELDELKRLMLQEQGELRSFIAALRSGSEVSLRDLAEDLRGLSERLSKHWAVECDFAAETSETMIPTRLHLHAHHLVREAVANAVRHAGARSVRIALAAHAGELRMDFFNDGAAFPAFGDRLHPPQSLQERVQQAGGTIELSRGMQLTKVSIALPIARRSA